MKTTKKFVKWLNSSTALKHIHLFLICFWLALWITAAIFGWLESVVFVSHLSAAALVLASASAWQAARVEEKEDDKD